MSAPQKELSTNNLHLLALHRLAQEQELPGLDILHLAVRTRVRPHLPALARLADSYFSVLWREAEMAFDESADPNSYPTQPIVVGGACLLYTSAASGLAHTIRRRAQGNRPHGPGDVVWNVLVAALAICYRRHAAAGDLTTLTALVEDIADSIGTL